MKLAATLFRCALVTALTLAAATPVFATDLSLNGLRAYLAAGSTATEPGLLLVLGAGLIGLRIFMGKRTKRRDKEALNT